MVDPWAELGIPETRDVREIKKAYAARLKLVHPEDDAEGFQRLRQAYEMALAFGRWQAAEAAGQAEPVPSEAPWRPRVHVRPLDAASSPPDEAAALLRRLEDLQGDPAQRASEPAWRALLASETLWNLDTRHAFELSLLERLAGPDLVLAPVAWSLLQEEFHWTEQSLAFYQTLPHDSVERLMRRMERAPIDFGWRLCDEGRYEEARALARELVHSRHHSLSRAGQRLLTRCTAEEVADAVLRDVEWLRANNEASWASTTEWRALVERKELRGEAARHAFQRKLLGYLATCGSALCGPTWLLLDRAYHWTSTLADEQWARAASALGPAIVEAADDLERQGLQRDAITQLGRVAGKLEGDLGRRARQILERCCRQTLEKAEELAGLGRTAEALAEAAPVASMAGGDLAARARSLVERAGGATLGSARQLLSKRRHQEVIATLQPVIDLLPGPLATEGRFLQARSYVGEAKYPEAEELLEQVLAAEPSNIPAARLMAFVLRQRGQLAHAAAVCQGILAIDPGDEQAARLLRAIENEQAQADKPASDGSGAGGGGVAPWFLFVLLFNALRSCAPTGPFDGSSLDGAKWLGVLVLLALGGAIFLAARSRSRLARLLETDVVANRWRSAGLLALGGVLIVAAFFLAIRLVSPSTEAPPASAGRLPFARPRAPVSWPREVRIVDFGASQSLPLKGGSRVTLWADVRYTLAAGTGVVKLVASGDPGGVPREIAAVQVARPSGVVRLQGGYSVPRGARKVDLLVPFFVLGSDSTSVAANAFLAVDD
jgi:tetratricopeptide (TPR) repeat protein